MDLNGDQITVENAIHDMYLTDANFSFDNKWIGVVVIIGMTTALTLTFMWVL